MVLNKNKYKTCSAKMKAFRDYCSYYNSSNHCAECANECYVDCPLDDPAINEVAQKVMCFTAWLESEYEEDDDD